MRKIEQPNIKIYEILQVLKSDNINYLDLSDSENTTKEQLYSKIEEELSKDESWYSSNFDKLIDFKTSLSIENVEDKIHKKYDEYNKTKTLRRYRPNLYELAKKRCPICDSSFAYSQVNLDHVLPKSEYKSLSITPINIVPICNCCNMKKSSKKGDKIFSPYFHEYDLTELLSARIIIDNVEEDDISIVIYVDEGFKGKYESEKDYENIIENINLYGILNKYSSIATIFGNEIINYFKKLIIITQKNLLFTKRQVKDLLSEHDLWKERLSSDEVKYCDETFIKHISVEAMRSSEEFLLKITNILNRNMDINELISTRIKEAIGSIKENNLKVFRINNNAFIRRILPGSDFVGYYKVIKSITGNYKCKLIDFQGPYQEYNNMNCFELNDKWESFNKAIQMKELQIACNQPHSDKISYYKNNIGTELIIPVINTKKECEGLVYIGLEGEIDSRVSLDNSLTQEFQNLISKMYIS